MLAQEIIRVKRDAGVLDEAQIAAFVTGLVDGGWSEGQAAALAMAIFLNGLCTDETVALTRAMTHSGSVIDWAAQNRWPDPRQALDWWRRRQDQPEARAHAGGLRRFRANDLRSVSRPVPASRDGWISQMATRDIGLLAIELGGGRRQASDRIDHRVGFSEVLGVGTLVRAGAALAMVHAADDAAAQAAAVAFAHYVQFDSQQTGPLAPLVVQRVTH